MYLATIYSCTNRNYRESAVFYPSIVFSTWLFEIDIIGQFILYIILETIILGDIMATNKKIDHR